MTSRLNKSLVLMALLATTACGGGGSDPVVITPTPGPAPNGLDYGAIGQALADAEGTEMTLASADFTAGSGAQVAQGGSVTLTTDFLTGNDANRTVLNGSIEILGEQVAISNGTGSMSGNRSVTVVYDPDRSGTYAGAVSFVAHESGGALAGETHYVFGFETDPAYITSGSANYSGGFLAHGASEAEYEGTIAIAVTFGGSVTGSLDGHINGTTDLDMNLSNGVSSGSGVTANLVCAGGTCSGSTSSLDATFYGPNAEELGGVLAINTNVFDGAGTFIITVAP